MVAPFVVGVDGRVAARVELTARPARRLACEHDAYTRFADALDAERARGLSGE